MNESEFNRNVNSIIKFQKEKRLGNSSKDKFKSLETLESKLSLNRFNVEKTDNSKESSSLDYINNVKYKQIRVDKFGTPIIKKGSHKISFASSLIEIRTFIHYNTIYEDQEIENKRIKKLNYRKIEKIDCVCNLF